MSFFIEVDQNIKLQIMAIIYKGNCTWYPALGYS